MSSLTTEKGIVHYEVYGRGKPVILLHGWLHSWDLWQESMAFLGKRYRTYALDFWGFGDSGKKLNVFSVPDFVSLVDEFMDRMGIVQAPLVGHSMGGTVALSLAITRPEKVKSITVIGSPINGNSLMFLLKLAGYRPIASLVFQLMGALKAGIRAGAPIITRDKGWIHMIDRDISKTTVDSFSTSISSLRKTNLTDTIEAIGVPVMGMYGAKDVIVNPNQWQPLQENIPGARIERITDAGHFPMLDTPERFQHTLLDFLDNSDNNNNHDQNHSE